MGEAFGADALTAESVDSMLSLIGRPGAVLYIDCEPLAGLSDIPARKASMHASLHVPNGAFAFRNRDRGWRCVIVRSERGQALAHAFQSSLPPGSDMWSAMMSFDLLWEQAQPVGTSTPRFLGGDGVQLKGGSGEIGTVTGEPSATTSGWLYRVRFGAVVRNVPESGLDEVEDVTASPESWARMRRADLDDFRLLLATTKLDRALSDIVYSYGATRTVFRAYQFKPLLKLLQTNSQRLLIADEVGLGKTIEAGLIWTEFDQRAGVRRGLVVCPAALTRKWRDEMQRRFNVELEIINRARLGEFADDLRADLDPPLLAAMSLESLRTADVLEELIELQPRFDLVIVDEAHYLRNRDTRSFELGDLLSDWADVLLFLSATPLNLGTDDLFNLLHLLAPERFPDVRTFEDQVAPNQVIMNAARRLTADPSTFAIVRQCLDELATIPMGASLLNRPEIGTLHRLLERETALEPADLATCRRSLHDLNTLSDVVTRTRKADVPDAQATRVADTIDVQWTPGELAFYNAVLAWARARAIANNGVVGFATVMPLRQAASCLPAMRSLLHEKYVKIEADDDDLDELPDEFLEPAHDSFDDELTEEELAATELRRAAQALGETDTKFDEFRGRLRAIRQSGIRQLMVFSFFRRTLSYLHERLRSEYSVRVMDGSVPPADRAQIMQDFRDGHFEILLLSEVGSEGLDFEFVGALVNFDLPWNPMRVEQRIGRLDRFGQTHERIHIFNFHVPGTIETDILERLYARIRVFESSIGELEPILRNEMNAITRTVLDPRRSELERAAEIDRIALAVENRSADLDRLEAHASGLMTGLDEVLIDGFESTVRAAGRYVGHEEVRSVVTRLIDDTHASIRRTSRGSSIWEIRGSTDLEQRSMQIARASKDRRIEDLSRRLRSGESLFVIFDSEAATEVSADLVVAGHPLVRAAVLHLRDAETIHWRHGAMTIPGDRSGIFVALVATIEVTGAQPARELICVTIDFETFEPAEEVGDALLGAAARGELRAASLDSATQEHVDALNRMMVDRRDRIEIDRSRSNDARIEAQRMTLDRTYRYKIERARSTLDKVSTAGRSESIERLWRGRITNLEARRDADLAALEEKRALTVSWEPVGIATVKTEP